MDNLSGVPGNNGPARSTLPTITGSMKWWLSIFLGVLFFIIAFPGTYNVTNAIWTSLGFPSFLTAPGCPSTLAVLIHALVFAIIIRLIMW